MANTVLLDNITHKNLKIRTGYSAEFGDSVNNVLIFPTEFAFIQREYPILFRKDEDGNFQSVALLGFDKEENLFLQGDRWEARYVPAVQQRGPFLIGFRQKEIDGELVREPMVHVDLDHPRIGNTEGAAVFLPHGGNSPYLERTNKALQTIYHGAEAAKDMFAALDTEGLIEPVNIDVNLDSNGRTQYKLPGFYTVSQEKLGNLSAEQLARLHKPGYLQLAMLAATSLGNINWLIELKNRKRATE